MCVGQGPSYARHTWLCSGVHQSEPAREVCGTSGKKCLRKSGGYEAEKTQEIQENARAGGTPELEQRRNKKHTQAAGVRERAMLKEMRRNRRDARAGGMPEQGQQLKGA